MKKLIMMCVFLALALSSFAQSYSIIAGGNGAGFSGDGGLAGNAMISRTSNIHIDNAGNIYFVNGNYRIRRIDGATRIITTVAGNGYTGIVDPTKEATQTPLPPLSFVTTDNAGNLYFVARVAVGSYATSVYKIADNKVLLVAGNGERCIDSKSSCGDGELAINAKFNNISSIAIHPTSNELFISDGLRNNVRKVDSAGYVSTVVGPPLGSNGAYSGDGGPALQAKLNAPRTIQFDSEGNLYINDSENFRIRKIDGSTQVISTFAGNGTWQTTEVGAPKGHGEKATSVGFRTYDGFVSDSSGNFFLIGDNFISSNSSYLPSRVYQIDADGRLWKIEENISLQSASLGNASRGELYISTDAASILEVSPTSPVETTTVYGNITDNLGNNLSGVTVYLVPNSGINISEASMSNTTGADGKYTLRVNSNGLGNTTSSTIIPLKDGYTFGMETIVTWGGHKEQNFIALPDTATAILSGSVSSAGKALQGVSIKVLLGEDSQSATTDHNGVYSFNSLANGSCLIIPSKMGYIFSPVSVTLPISGAGQTQNFTATADTTTYPISGQILNNAMPLEGVNVNIVYEGGSGDVITDSGGNFSYTALVGGSYTLTFTKAGYTFNPASVTINGINSAQVISTTPTEIIDTSISAEVLPTSSGKGYVKCSSEPLKIKIKNAKAGNIGMKIFTGRQARLVKDQNTNNPANGDITLEWDCSTQGGGRADSGVYMVVINGGGISNKKLKVGVLK